MIVFGTRGKVVPGRVLPLFTGLALVCVFAVFVAFGAAEQSKKEAAFLAAPAVGDLYVVKIGRFAKGSDPKYPYGVLRVASLAGANLELQLGKFGYNRPSGAAVGAGAGAAAAEEPGRHLFGETPLTDAAEREVVVARPRTSGPPRVRRRGARSQGGARGAALAWSRPPSIGRS